MEVPDHPCPDHPRPDHRGPDHRGPDHRRPDHRRLGRQLKNFASDEACGAGLPLWLPAGSAVRSEIERFIVDLERRYGYQHVFTPEMAKREIVRAFRALGPLSGRYVPAHGRGERTGCTTPDELSPSHPGLPLRAAHHSGNPVAPGGARDNVPERALRSRRRPLAVRQMTLNDGRVFCAAEDVEQEIASILELVDVAYKALAIPAPSLRLSRPDVGPKYVPDAVNWARSEQVIRAALARLGLEWTEADGEAAFYGPKIDLQVVDPQGREETLSTIQLDFLLPERFELSFNRAGAQERPVMVHRSIVSTMERMVAHLLEVHNGALPVWLAPTQAVVMPATSGAVAYAREVKDALVRAGLPRRSGRSRRHSRRPRPRRTATPSALRGGRRGRRGSHPGRGRPPSLIRAAAVHECGGFCGNGHRGGGQAGGGPPPVSPAPVVSGARTSLRSPGSPASGSNRATSLRMVSSRNTGGNQVAQPPPVSARGAGQNELRQLPGVVLWRRLVGREYLVQPAERFGFELV